MREIDTVIDGMTERSSPARDDLALTDAQVAEMSAQERAARVEEVKVEANTLLDWAVQERSGSVVWVSPMVTTERGMSFLSGTQSPLRRSLSWSG
jgi:hypothetical protein